MCAALIAVAAAAAGATPEPRAIFPPFAHAPLDGPLIITGTFGEYRPGRFHAGLDYSTNGEVGKPVYAPLDGWIERIRTSGAGYGRSLYLHARDGRTIVFGHFDAYDEPLASFVAAVQESSGQYEQDLWVERDRFAVHAGQRLGWSGQSGGIGEPHLHLEVRRGDMAIHPLLAGASAEEDSLAPTIVGISVEPRDSLSRLNGALAPVRIALGARAETLAVAGAARVEVDAHDPGERRSDMQPYEIELAWDGHHVTCRMDSLSWATDMVEGDLVFDRGRLFPARSHAVLMWAPAGFRARAIVSDEPLEREAGDLSGAGIVKVTVTTRDFFGHAAAKEFFARLSPALGTAAPRALGWEHRLEGFSWQMSADASFGAGTGFESLSCDSIGREPAIGDLAPAGRAIHIGPDWIVLRKPFTLRARVPIAHPDRRLGLYVRRDGDWELLTTEPDTSRGAASVIAHPTHLGTFAFFTDRLAPRIALRRPPRHRGAAEPYSRWTLEARLTEVGSGVDSRASYFLVDGKRRPTEWDGVHQMLRWKPLAAPRAGAHRYLVVACDRAGNTRRATGRFVIN